MYTDTPYINTQGSPLLKMNLKMSFAPHNWGAIEKLWHMRLDSHYKWNLQNIPIEINNLVGGRLN